MILSLIKIVIAATKTPNPAVVTSTMLPPPVGYVISVVLVWITIQQFDKKDHNSIKYYKTTTEYRFR